MQRLFVGALLTALSLGVAQSVHAEALPKNAVKLSSAEAKSIYSGKTANWPKVYAYFAPGGQFLMVDKGEKWFGEGKWTVHGNRVCASIRWTNVESGETGKGKQDCWTWYKAGDRLLSLWSGDKNGVKGGWNDGEQKKLSNGDQVSSTFKTLKAKAQKSK